MYIGLHVQYRSFLSDFGETCIFSEDFRKNTYKYQISKKKSVQREKNCSIQTDMTKLIVAFRNFANPSNKIYTQINIISYASPLFLWAYLLFFSSILLSCDDIICHVASASKQATVYPPAEDESVWSTLKWQ
jgi:hypothetical protein